jgi:sugar diacid utilization regulator
VFEGEAPAGWLAALLASATVSRHVARPVVRTAAELLGLVSVTRRAALRERRERRGRLGARLVRMLAGEPDEALPAALAADGIDFTRPCRAAVLALPRNGGVQEALEAALDASGNVAVASVGRETILLAQDGMRELCDRLEHVPRLAAVRAGLSEPFERLDQAAAAIDQARLALMVAVSTPGAPAVQYHEALEPSVALLGPSSAQPVRDRLVGALAPLDDEPRLRAAVIAYLDAGLDVGRAARALGLHRNSVRYRLDRAEDVLGRSLRSPETVATIHLALLAERLTTARRP